MTASDAVDEIDAIVVHQYETIRRSGECNMFDQACVQRAALDREFVELVLVIDEGRYPDLLDNYAALSRRYLEDE